MLAPYDRLRLAAELACLHARSRNAWSGFTGCDRNRGVSPLIQRVPALKKPSRRLIREAQGVWQPDSHPAVCACCVDVTRDAGVFVFGPPSELRGIRPGVVGRTNWSGPLRGPAL